MRHVHEEPKKNECTWKAGQNECDEASELMSAASAIFAFLHGNVLIDN